jgi:hypothetical protein
MNASRVKRESARILEGSYRFFGYTRFAQVRKKILIVHAMPREHNSMMRCWP